MPCWGGGDGGPPRGAVGVAQRSGPPCRGVSGWAHPAEPRMWSIVVVVHSPSREHGAGMRQRAKQRLVEQLVAQPSDERFGEGILRRLAWRDVVPRHVV